MIRMIYALLAVLVSAEFSFSQTADQAPAESWKLTYFNAQGRPGFHPQPVWLVTLQTKDGKWTGKLLDSRISGASLEVGSADGLLRLTFQPLPGVSWPMFPGKPVFEAKIPQPGAKIIHGSIEIGSESFPAELEATTIKSFDPYELAKETFANKDAGHNDVMEAGIILVEHAARKNAAVEEVRNWADKALKAAEIFGPSIQRQTAARLAEGLTDKAFAAIGLDYARKAEQLLNDKVSPFAAKNILDVLAEALKNTGKEQEAKAVATRSAQIELFKRPTFPGRKDKSDRVVLVELFTGAQCPPCVAADLAFDALAKTYKPTEVALLQYHEHIPGPDPLTNPDTEDRMAYYRKAISGTPTILFNGKAAEGGGGGRDRAEGKHAAYYGVITPLLDQPAKAILKATASRKGPKIDITAEVSDLNEPGEKIRLRFALVEEHIRYKGGNKLPSHHYVVRALPGGIKGIALTEKTSKQMASVDLDELRSNLKKYLDDYAGKGRAFPNADRPLELRDLHVVAFIQNDETNEVLQAVRVEVSGEEGKK